MKLTVTLSLAWILCCYTVAALQCHTCSNSSDAACSSTTLQTCTSNQRCITASLDSSVSGGIATSVYKGCVSNSICKATTNLTTSANLGRGTGLVTSSCCDTDSCNSDTLTVPSVSTQTANDLRCYTCENDTQTTTCNTSLTCVGVQDRCVSGQANSDPARKTYGCVSSNFCSAAARLSVFTPLASLASFTTGPTCCSTNLCNAASAPRSLGGAVVPLALWVVASITLSS